MNLVINRGILVLILLLCTLTTRAELLVDSLAYDRTSHKLSASVDPGLIVPSHYFLRGNNHEGRKHLLAGSAHLKYSFTFPRNSSFARSCSTSSQGIGMGVHSLFSHKNFGTPISLYIHQSADILNLTPKISLGYGWNLGAAYGWKTANGFDLMDESYTNPFTSTEATVYLAVGIYLAYSPNRSFTYRLGPEYTHFSNGDTSYPNQGIDLISLKLEVSRNMYSGKVHSGSYHEMDIRGSSGESTLKNRMRYDLMLYGAWRADKALVNGRPFTINDTFLVCGLMFNPLYPLTRNISAGVSADFIFDRSSDLTVEAEDYGKVLSYGYPSPLSQMALGLSLRGELTMPIFSVNLGFGYNLISSGSDLKSCYALFILKTFITDRLNLNFGYRLSTNLYVRNLMFGLGWSFGSTASEPIFRSVKYK